MPSSSSGVVRIVAVIVVGGHRRRPGKPHRPSANGVDAVLVAVAASPVVVSSPSALLPFKLEARVARLENDYNRRVARDAIRQRAVVVLRLRQVANVSQKRANHVARPEDPVDLARLSRRFNDDEGRTRRKRARRTAPEKPVAFAMVALFLFGDPFLWIASMEAILWIG